MKIYATRLNNLSDLDVLKALAGTDKWVLVEAQGPDKRRYYERIAFIENGKIAYTHVPEDYLGRDCIYSVRLNLSEYLSYYKLVRPIEIILTQDLEGSEV